MNFAPFQMVTASGGLVGAIFGILAEGAGSFFDEISIVFLSHKFIAPFYTELCSRPSS